jgi:hypothetical protein
MSDHSRKMIYEDSCNAVLGQVDLFLDIPFAMTHAQPPESCTWVRPYLAMRSFFVSSVVEL